MDSVIQLSDSMTNYSLLLVALLGGKTYQGGTAIGLIIPGAGLWTYIAAGSRDQSYGGVAYKSDTTLTLIGDEQYDGVLVVGYKIRNS